MEEEPVADGYKMFMVAMEMLMALFALLYAFPHVPSQILDPGDGDTKTWFSVATHQELVSGQGGIIVNYHYPLLMSRYLVFLRRHL